MKRFKNYLLAGLFAFFAGGSAMATIPTGTALAADCSGSNIILTFPAWYRGLSEAEANGGCAIKSPDAVGGLEPFIWKIVLNVVDMLLQIAGYIAVGFIIYGGFLYMTSGGSADRAVQAKKSILNAIIGLVIAIGSVAIVNLISNEGLNL